MGKMKTEFKLHTFHNGRAVSDGEISIVGESPKESPYVTIDTPGEIGFYFISGNKKTLERFAVNILKALKSKRLKP